MEFCWNFGFQISQFFDKISDPFQQNFIVFYFFLFYFTCLWFSKKLKIFLLFYCMDPRFYRKIEIFEIPNFNKIPSFSTSFLVFMLFYHFVFYFTYRNLFKKLSIFLWYFIGSVRGFTYNFWKILKVLFKKILMWNIFFSKFSFSILVIFFFSYFTYPNLSKNSKHFCDALLYGL